VPEFKFFPEERESLYYRRWPHSSESASTFWSSFLGPAHRVHAGYGGGHGRPMYRHGEYVRIGGKLGEAFDLADLEEAFDVFAKNKALESREPVAPESPSDYERLLGRHKMLLALMGTEELNTRLDHLFPYKLERSRAVIIFEGPESFSLNDFAWTLGSIDRLYKLLLSLLHKGYFVDKWLRNVPPNFAEEDLLLVEKIVKQSPAQVQVSAISEAAKALSDVLSIGKQVTDFKTAGVKVEEAKLDLERKKREFAEEDRKRGQQAALSDLDLEIEREKKLLELEQLRTKRDEEQRKRQRQLIEDIDQRLDLLSKGIKVLSEVPEEVKLELRAALFTELEIMSRTSISVKSLQIAAGSDGEG
jgi:hypothetical protein